MFFISRKALLFPDKEVFDESMNQGLTGRLHLQTDNFKLFFSYNLVS